MTEADGGTLTDRKGLGGLIALDGFDYQVWDLIRRIPVWLANPAFEHVIYEGMEDFEARFFAPHATELAVLERFQAKQSILSPAEMKAVFRSFRAFDDANPKTARIQSLVMPGLPPSLAWMNRHLDRVRNARPFYSPFASLLEADDRALLEKLGEEFPDGLGEFIANNAEVSIHIHPDRPHAFQAFQAELDRVFPRLDLGARAARVAFDSLESTVRGSTGSPLSAIKLSRTIEDAAGRPLHPDVAYPILIRSDRTSSDETRLEIDASTFSGSERPFPNPQQWSSELARPLTATAKWLSESNRSRVQLAGKYRISTAMLVGWSFRSAIGFELEIPTKEGYWSTNDRPIPGEAFSAWDVRMPSTAVSGRMIVAIGVLRDPVPTIIRQLGVPAESILALHLPLPITSAKDAQASVGTIKRSVDQAVASVRPSGIDLYMAGPAALAVALGHRWSAMPSTQLHEFDAVDSLYRATAILD